MEPGEKRLKQEDCSEDELGTGILTLTNQRVAFDKRKSRIADFSTKMGETVLDVPLNELLDVWKEGRFIKKICIKLKQMMVKNLTNLACLALVAGLKTFKMQLKMIKDQ